MFSIRPAKPEEAEQLTAIAQAAKAHWGYPERWLEIWKPQLTFTPEYIEEYESWVAEMDGAPIAFCTLLEKEENAWLENLWVLPAYIGKGVGKTLFLFIVEQARQRGYRTLQLEADPNAVGFYQRMGMHKIGEGRYEIEGQPRLLPILKISI